MEEVMRTSAQLEDVAELMHNILLRLSVEEAARTSVLSKSWLHAWSTIPTLRLRVGRRKPLKLVDVDRIVARYLHDNIPIKRFNLVIDIENQESASHAENWIGPVAAKTCLKELSLSVYLFCNASFTLPDEILSGENLTKIRVYALTGIGSIWMTMHPVIKCVRLRELHLENVCLSEKVFDEILSSCHLLVKIELIRSCKGFKAIKVKNLHRLRELKIELEDEDSTALEISHVPKLRVFSWDLVCMSFQNEPPPLLLLPFNAHSISLGSNVTQLFVGGVITDNAILEKITSGFSFLKILTLELTSWTLGSFSFTSASIKRLSLLRCPHMLTDVQVYAPKLDFFSFDGYTVPNLLFPTSTLKEIELSLQHRNPIDASFFLKMREALMLSRKCHLRISYAPPLNINIDDLRTRLQFPPAKNVQQVWFHTYQDECLWERSPFFDAFFEICHPKIVFAYPDRSFRQNNHFCKLMLREVLEKNTTSYWAQYVKRVQIKQSRDREWETLTNTHTSFLQGPAPSLSVAFKLNWT